MSNTDEALKIWNALKPMIDREIKAKTDSCVRAKKMLVTTAPNETVIGVTEPYGTEIFVPYSSEIATSQVGDTVWVWYFYNNASTMIALTFGSGLTDADSFEMPIGSIYMTVSDQNPASMFGGTWTRINGHPVYPPEPETVSESRSVSVPSRTRSETVSSGSAARRSGMPVGSVYMTVSNQNPSALFGGTWVRINGHAVYPPTPEE